MRGKIILLVLHGRKRRKAPRLRMWFFYAALTARPERDGRCRICCGWHCVHANVISMILTGDCITSARLARALRFTFWLAYCLCVWRVLRIYTSSSRELYDSDLPIADCRSWYQLLILFYNSISLILL